MLKIVSFLANSKRAVSTRKSRGNHDWCATQRQFVWRQGECQKIVKRVKLIADCSNPQLASRKMLAAPGESAPTETWNTRKASRFDTRRRRRSGEATAEGRSTWACRASSSTPTNSSPRPVHHSVRSHFSEIMIYDAFEPIKSFSLLLSCYWVVCLSSWTETC